jgi:tRNA uridine 5-carboxymethylaminomethyl modification enzyme
LGKKLGIISNKRWALFNKKIETLNNEKERLQKTIVKQETIATLDHNATKNTSDKTAYELLKRPGISYKELINQIGKRAEHKKENKALGINIGELLETEAKYEGYVIKQKREIEKQKTHSETKLPESLDYTRLPGLSNELKQKLTEFAPKTIGHAARIQGITPAALSVLLVHLKKQKIKRAQGQ